jgi:tetratricopeptide (TPR) repeat protein
MREPLRTAPADQGPATDADREALIEKLLLAGLDHYFEGRYEQAVNVWTRVLFLDRGHARARAYIERARGAVSERQRESEELLHTGVAAFQRGDSSAARELLRSAVERGAPADEALLVLDRLDRLGASAGAAGADEHGAPPAHHGRRGPGLARRPGRRGRRAAAVAAIAVALAAAGAALVWWDRLAPWRLLDRAAETTSVRPVPDEPLPVPQAGEIALARAQALFQKGRLHEALRALAVVRPGDPLSAEADTLRASIQTALLGGADAPPKDGR